jgi:hypothetical protein
VQPRPERRRAERLPLDVWELLVTRHVHQRAPLLRLRVYGTTAIH